jgi:cyclophilin family peptidyl-prolyl cis-trans isomerase
MTIPDALMTETKAAIVANPSPRRHETDMMGTLLFSHRSHAMKHLFHTLILAGAATLASFTANADADHPRVQLQTNMGNITVELDRKAAPNTVENFIKYVDDGSYNGTIFHRVISDFMIQGGGFTPDYNQKKTRAPIKNEANNGLKNVRGTIAMARTGDPHSATTQFFINTVDNGFLNHTSQSMQGWGYAVFGKVVEGMETVDKIRAVPTGRGGPFPSDVPREKVIINKATVVADK